MVAVELEPLIQQKKPLSAGLAVVIVLVILLPSVILGMVLSVWVSSMTPTDGAAPTITLTHTGTVSWTGVSRVNVTWMISGVSRSDIKWTDTPTSSMKILVGGASVVATITKNAGGTYVTGGDTISANMTATVCPTGSVVQLIIVYTPTGSTCGTVTTTVTY